MAERARLPAGLLEEIIDSRAYARAYQANQVDPASFGRSPMRTLAMTIAAELSQEEEPEDV